MIHFTYLLSSVNDMQAILGTQQKVAAAIYKISSLNSPVGHVPIHFPFLFERGFSYKPV